MNETNRQVYSDFRAREAFDKLLTLNFETVIDVGCGFCEHAQEFRDNGKTVFPVDLKPLVEGVIQADYNLLEIEKADAVWCCHVLEHQLNVNTFLSKIYRDLKPGGYLAITVPPLKHNIVGGHLTLWNAGLLLYNLILAGFDCSEAMVKEYGYNISVIVQKKRDIELPELNYDNGDIEKLAEFFPPNCRTQGFLGNFTELNWD
jgi:SAM-dependent methyltransferase